MWANAQRHGRYAKCMAPAALCSDARDHNTFLVVYVSREM